jgi:hypothetical protein
MASANILHRAHICAGISHASIEGPLPQTAIRDFHNR